MMSLARRPSTLLLGGHVCFTRRAPRPRGQTRGPSFWERRRDGTVERHERTSGQNVACSPGRGRRLQSHLPRARPRGDSQTFKGLISREPSSSTDPSSSGEARDGARVIARSEEDPVRPVVEMLVGKRRPEPLGLGRVVLDTPRRLRLARPAHNHIWLVASPEDLDILGVPSVIERLHQLHVSLLSTHDPYATPERWPADTRCRDATRERRQGQASDAVCARGAATAVVQHVRVARQSIVGSASRRTSPASSARRAAAAGSSGAGGSPLAPRGGA